MTIRNKIIKSGDSERVSRLHTLRGQRIPSYEIFTIPVELVLRILRIHRKGPWLCNPAIRLLTQLIRETQPTKILEIGGGRSSEYFSRRVSSLLTIEEDESWANRITEIVNTEKCHFKIEVTDVESWLPTRNKANMEFDIVLIDGSTDLTRKRAIEQLPFLNPAAIYILDNSDRAIFNNLNFALQPTKIIRKHGLVRHPFQATETSFYWFK